MYKLATFVLITLSLSFTYTANAQAKDEERHNKTVNKNLANECKDMEGKYSVVPFTRPLGLAEAADVYGLSAPLGTPVFKVEREVGQLKHIGLVEGNRFDIKLQNKIDQKLASLNDIFGIQIVKCSYKLSDDFYVIKVDLQQVDEKSLVEMADYIPKSWGSVIIDFGRGDAEEIYENPSIATTEYRLDSKSLRSVHYFLIQDVEMIGVISYVVMIPLQKVPQ